MVERRLALRRYGIGAAALLTGVLLFWVALHSEGGDWFISETHADVIYTALYRFKELPYFSWAFNGGSYFLQDPQSNLFSPATPAILLAGPSIGLRLFEGVWGVAGVLAFAGWMRRRVSLEAALIGAVASATALGVLWRVAIGNDMFLWHLGLPLLLWTVERVMKERTLASSLWFGLTLGVLMLGPTFHSFTYLFVPVVPSFVLIEWAFERPSPKAFLRTVLLFVLACAIALSMASFKLVSWLTFPMVRQVNDVGVLPWLSGLEQLFDYSNTQWLPVTPTRFIGLVGRAYRAWGTEEGATALPPLATLLALVGLIAGFGKRLRKSGTFALFSLILGLSLSCWSPAWEAFRALNGGNFRVAQRCLGIAAFGVTLFATLGAEAVLTRMKRGRGIAAGVAIASFLVSAVWWTRDAAHYANLTNGDCIQPAAINPIARSHAEKSAAAEIDRFSAVRPYRGERDVLDGFGYSDGFLVVGNEFNARLYAPGKRRFPPDPSTRVLPFVLNGLPRDRVSVEHLRIKIRKLPKLGQLTLRVREPRFGLVVKTTPPDADVVVQGVGNQVLLVENRGNQPVERVVIRAALPLSVAWFALSGAALLGTLISLLFLARARRRADAAPFVGGTQPLESL